MNYPLSLQTTRVGSRKTLHETHSLMMSRPYSVTPEFPSTLELGLSSTPFFSSAMTLLGRAPEEVVHCRHPSLVLKWAIWGSNEQKSALADIHWSICQGLRNLMGPSAPPQHCPFVLKWVNSHFKATQAKTPSSTINFVSTVLASRSAPAWQFPCKVGDSVCYSAVTGRCWTMQQLNLQYAARCQAVAPRAAPQPRF